MTQLALEDKSARGRIQIHRDNQGRLMTVHTVWGGRNVQRNYMRKYARFCSQDPCVRPEAIQVEPRLGRWLLGPCDCDDLQPPCEAIKQAIRHCDASLPGRNRLGALEFAGGEVTVLATYYEREVPQLGHIQSPLVRTLVSSTDSAAGVPGGLDPVEARTLRQAIQLGYYDSPRRVNMEDLADSLGITKSAVCRRLNKLERTAVDRLLKEQDDPETFTPPTGEWTKPAGLRRGLITETRAHV